MRQECNWGSKVRVKGHVCCTCAERLFLFRLFSFLLRRTPVSLERPKPLLTLDSLDWVVGATASPRLMHFFSYTGTAICQSDVNVCVKKGQKNTSKLKMWKGAKDDLASVLIYKNTAAKTAAIKSIELASSSYWQCTRSELVSGSHYLTATSVLVPVFLPHPGGSASSSGPAPPGPAEPWRCPRALGRCRAATL